MLLWRLSLRRAFLLLSLAGFGCLLLWLGPLQPTAPAPAPAPPAPRQQAATSDEKPDDDDVAPSKEEPEDNPLISFEIENEVTFPDRPWFVRGGLKRPLPSEKRPPMFPDEVGDGNDRIIEQLMFVPQDYMDAENNAAPPPMKKILLANGIDAWNTKPGRHAFAVKSDCPVNRCEITVHQKDASKADAIIFRDNHVKLYGKRPANQIWILYYLECPYHTTSAGSSDQFNWTATYRRDSDIVAPYERWYYYDPLVRQKKIDKNYAANKTKKVAWFVSNCFAHNRRLQYARDLAKHIQVDIYGTCGSGEHVCSRSDKQYCYRMLDAEYKFYLAFENSNCKDYITEKFFINGLSWNTVPIVMGGSREDYEAVAPYHSYIHVDDFDGPEQLAQFLDKLDKDDDLYSEYFAWKGTGEFINTHFMCRVCAMLHAGRGEGVSPPRFYRDVNAWWRADGVCRA